MLVLCVLVCKTGCSEIRCYACRYNIYYHTWLPCRHVSINTHSVVRVACGSGVLKTVAIETNQSNSVACGGFICYTCV